MRSHEPGGPMPNGRLLLGATPLGQPSDASPRLIGALATADIVAAEDTRRLRILAKALEVTISGKVVSFFDHVEAARVPALVEQVNAGATVLVVSDAGMPLISDPGHRLVAACVAAGIVVQCLPGPSAVTTALAVSGLPSERFCFEGFAPRKQAARRSWLASLAAEQRTAVFFESPRRLHTCLLDAVDQLGGDRRAAVCRELAAEAAAAPMIRAALCRHSSHSASGSESAVIPPPEPSTALPAASNSTVRMATFSSHPATGDAKPIVPQ